MLVFCITNIILTPVLSACLRIIEVQKEINVLIIASGWFRGTDDVNDGKFDLFSQRFQNCIALRTDRKDCRYVKTSTHLTRGFYQPSWVRRTRILSRLQFFTAAVLEFGLFGRRKWRADIVVARDPLSSGLTSLVISRLLGIPFIVELNGNFANDAIWQRPDGRTAVLRRRIAWRVKKFVIQRAAAVKQIYPTQLAELSIPRVSARLFTFHNYVAPSDVQKHEKQEGDYLISMGFPWYIKGYDILINAYNLVLKENPNYPYSLRIVGWIRDHEKEELASRCDFSDPRIHLLSPVPYEEGQQLIANAAAFVLASRTDAMARVLIEAMRAGTLCISSRVDGIPHYIRDHETGLLFDSGDERQLADQIASLTDNDYTALIENAQQRAQEDYSVASFTRHYEEMLTAVLEDAAANNVQARVS